MLGGETPASAIERAVQGDEVRFIGDARENPGSIQFTVVLRTRRLLPNTYPTSKLPLSDKVLALRDERGMTFKAIAELLSSEGWRGARGAPLDAKEIYSVYAKRRAQELDRATPICWWITGIVVSPPRQ